MLPHTADDVGTAHRGGDVGPHGKWQPRIVAMIAVCWIAGAIALAWLLLLATR